MENFKIAGTEKIMKHVNFEDPLTQKPYEKRSYELSLSHNENFIRRLSTPAAGKRQDVCSQIREPVGLLQGKKFYQIIYADSLHLILCFSRVSKFNQKNLIKKTSPDIYP